MNNLWKLADYVYTKNPKLKSFFYRHQNWLNKKCSDYPALDPFDFSKDVMRELALYGPCEDLEISRAVLEITRKHHTPNDPKFYRMLLSQAEIWRAFQDKPLQFFFESDAAKTWHRRRKKLGRKALFEFDTPYKKSKAQALDDELKVRNLLRKNPLLRFEDLKRLGVRNSQAILERFPYLSMHRENYLKSLEDFLHA